MKDENDLTNNPELIKKIISSYDRFVPYQLLKLIGKNNIIDVKLGDQIEKKITILFTDIRDFTTLSETLSPEENFNFINSYFSQMEPIINVQDGIIDKFIGDAIMAIFPNDANDALHCALLMLKQLKHYNEGRKRAGYKPINIGIGLNTGLAMLGTIGGFSRMESTVISDSVNLASRIESLTKKYGVKLLISEHTLRNIAVASEHCIRFIDRVLVKGKYQPQSVYEVFDQDEPEIKKLKLETKQMFEEALAYYHFKQIEEAKELLDKCVKLNPDDQPAKVYLKRCKMFLKTGEHEGTKELTQQLEWSSYFEVGNEEIDKQHYELLTNSIKLLHMVDQENKKSEIEKFILFLDDYVSKHFTTEEKYLHDNKYPFIDHQKIQHRRFTVQFEQLKNEINESKMSKTFLMFKIQILLIDWVVNHTLKEDKHFGKYINNLKE